MGQYTQYIQEHINNFNGQLPFHWKTPGYWRRLGTVCFRYREMHGTNDLSESIDRLSDRIGREDIRNLFLKGQFYDGYVATMLWGGIDLTRRNDIQETNGYKALTIKKDVIVEKLKRVSDLLLNNDLPNAFLSFLDNGENRIEGIALSYFTKLLFFIPNNISPKPLIYDKWGIRIHAALMKDENKNYDNSLNIYDPQPFVRGGNNRRVLFQSYLEYCSRINNLYGSLHIDSSKDIEAFLFGTQLRGTAGHDPERNPRKMLVNYLDSDNCNDHSTTSQSTYDRHVSSSETINTKQNKKETMKKVSKTNEVSSSNRTNDDQIYIHKEETVFLNRRLPGPEKPVLFIIGNEEFDLTRTANLFNRDYCRINKGPYDAIMNYVQIAPGSRIPCSITDEGNRLVINVEIPL